MSISTAELCRSVFPTVVWAAIIAWTPLDSVAAEDEEQAGEIEQIVVTGTRIHNSISEMSPVLVLDREALRRSGALTVSQALQQLTLDNSGTVNDRNLNGAFGASAVSFRGLGPNAVLILVNGRRLSQFGFSVSSSEKFSSFTDINSIPLSAVERIDVLKDGGSALYGSGAITGVVNIVLRRDFVGAELALRTGFSHDGGAEEKALNAIWGTVRGGTSAQIMATYSKRDELYFRERPISRSADHTSYGGTDHRSMAAGNFWHEFPASPFGGDCEERGDVINGVQEFELVEVPDFFGGTTQQCLYDFNTQMTEPSAERLGAMALLFYRFNDALALNFESSFSRSRLESRDAAAPVSVLFSQDNPWSPFGFDTYSSYRLLEAGPRKDILRSDTLRVLLELEGSFRQWSWNAGVLLSTSKTSDDGFGYVSRSALDAAANGVDLDGDGTLQPDEFLNVYTPASNPNSQALIDTLRTRRSFAAKTELFSVDATISRPIAALESGNVIFAAGLERREETLRDRSGADARSRDISGSVIGTPAPGSGDRQLDAVFAELLIPVLATLDLQAVIRYDDYDDIGTQRSNKVTLNWRPLDRLTFRASRSKNFRAPSLVELYAPPEVFVTFVYDERRCPIDFIDDDCFVVAPLGQFGGYAGLKPETADMTTVGLSAEIFRGFNVDVDYWSVAQQDRIAFPDYGYIAFSEDLLGPAYVRRREPTEREIELGLPGRIAELNLLVANLSRQRIDGYDVQLSYALELASLSQLNFSLYWTRLSSNEFRLYPPGTFDRFPDYRDSLRINGFSPFAYQEITGRYGIPENRLSLNALWRRNEWEVGLRGRWTDGFDQPADLSSPEVTQVASHIEWDASVAYAPNSKLGLSFGIENIFDATPPFSRGSFGNMLDQIKGFPTAYYDMRGRFAHVSATIRIW